MLFYIFGTKHDTSIQRDDVDKLMNPRPKYFDICLCNDQFDGRSYPVANDSLIWNEGDISIKLRCTTYQGVVIFGVANDARDTVTRGRRAVAVRSQDHIQQRVGLRTQARESDGYMWTLHGGAWHRLLGKFL